MKHILHHQVLVKVCCIARPLASACQFVWHRAYFPNCRFSHSFFIRFARTQQRISKPIWYIFSGSVAIKAFTLLILHMHTQIRSHTQCPNILMSGYAACSPQATYPLALYSPLPPSGRGAQPPGPGYQHPGTSWLRRSQCRRARRKCE